MQLSVNQLMKKLPSTFLLMLPKASSIYILKTLLTGISSQITWFLPLKLEALRLILETEL
jgi:hypothetical protein